MPAFCFLFTCCKKCNSEKGNGLWVDFLNGKGVDDSQRKERITKIHNYLEKYLPKKLSYENTKKICANEIKEYNSIKNQIFDLMKRADVVAQSIKNKVTKI